MIKWEKIRKNKQFISKDKSIRLEVGEKGFCLWVKDERWHWIIDASKILEKNGVSCFNEYFLEHKAC